MPLVVTPKNCDPSVKKAIQQISKKLGYTGRPTFAGLTLKVPGTNDANLTFKTANHQMNVYLDESLTNDEIVFAGQTASKNTQVNILAKDGENATLYLTSGSLFSYITHLADDRLQIANNNQDEDIFFQINDGGVAKTITWDADVDKLVHSAGIFNFDGKITAGSFSSPIDVTATREYGFELHYSGNDYNATTIRARAHAVTSDTSAQFQGGLFQAANNNGIDVGVLNGIISEAIGKSDSTSAIIGTMRGGFSGAEWGAKDTVTNLFGHHIRVHSLNAAGEGSFGDGYGLYIENEAVGGNGQALDAGIYFKDTTMSGGNKGYTYGIDFTGATYGTSQINLIAAGSISMAGTRVIKFDDTNYNMLLGSDAFQNDNGQYNVGIGYQVGYYNNTTGGALNGDNNVYIGYNSGKGDVGGSTGYGNVGIGTRTLEAVTSGRTNISIGQWAGLNLDTGISNCFIGISAGQGNTSGIHNVAFGYAALQTNTISNYNMAIGSGSLRYVTGTNNTAIGFQTGANLAGGTNFNTAIGPYALQGIYGTSTGLQYNIAIGYISQFSVTTASKNTTIGTGTGYSVTSGSSNIFIGYDAGYRQTTLSNLLIVDNQLRANAATELTNAIFYGVMAATPANQSLRINVGDLSIVSGTPYQTLINDTHEDGDGGRESRFDFKGEQSGGELTTLARIEVSHDGAADDEKGKIVISTNDGSDINTPTDHVKIDAAGNTYIGDGGATNYTKIETGGSQSFAGTARIDWTKITANGVTIRNAHGTTGSSVSDLQTAHDGNFYTLSEESGETPGMDIEVDFTGVTAFNWIQILARYEQGVVSHGITIMLEITPFDGSAWHRYNYFSDQGANLTNEEHSFFVPDDSAYINSGIVKVRFVHEMIGTSSNHDLVIDVCALYQ